MAIFCLNGSLTWFLTFSATLSRREASSPPITILLNSLSKIDRNWDLAILFACGEEALASLAEEELATLAEEALATLALVGGVMSKIASSTIIDPLNLEDDLGELEACGGLMTVDEGRGIMSPICCLRLGLALVAIIFTSRFSDTLQTYSKLTINAFLFFTWTWLQ